MLKHFQIRFLVGIVFNAKFTGRLNKAETIYWSFGVVQNQRPLNKTFRHSFAVMLVSVHTI